MLGTAHAQPRTLESAQRLAAEQWAWDMHGYDTARSLLEELG